MDEVLVALHTPLRGCATISLNRPDRGNALTENMTTLLVNVLSELAHNQAIYVVVLRAVAGSKYFCTGMDLSAASQSESVGAKELFSALKSFPKPLVGRINGPCLGGGIGLLFGCDVRVAGPSFYATFAEVRRGLVPALISALIVPQLGPFLSRQYMLTGERISGQTLYAHGQLSDFVENDLLLDSVVEQRVSELLQGAPNALQEIKHLVNYVATHSESESHVQVVFKRMMMSKEATEGLAAFREKRPPKWVSKL